MEKLRLVNTTTPLYIFHNKSLYKILPLFESMEADLYPLFTIVESRGFIPNIPLPENYKQIVPRFYEQGRKADVEEFVSDLEKMIKGTDHELPIMLQWDEEQGLTNIAIGAHGGLDLNDEDSYPSFQEHNLGWTNSLMASAIAMKYVSELLRSHPKYDILF